MNNETGGSGDPSIIACLNASHFALACMYTHMPTHTCLFPSHKETAGPDRSAQLLSPKRHKRLAKHKLEEELVCLRDEELVGSGPKPSVETVLPFH